MRKLFIGASLLLLLSSKGVSQTVDGFDHKLPPASEFRLTLREDPNANVPVGPSCGGEAGLTLTCRAFTLDLENAGTHTVHLSGLECFEPNISFLRRDPNSSSGLWPISQPGRPTCKESNWTNDRLRPGEHTQYSTRLIAERREVQPIGAGTYIVHAEWTLFGCTEDPGGADCLAPLQAVREGSSVADGAFYGPVMVSSNEVTVESPALPNLGELKFSFDVRVAAGEVPPSDSRDAAGCTPDSGTIECTVFHYSIRNAGDRAVRNGRFTCSDSDIYPEYFLPGAGWKPVPTVSWFCGANSLVEDPILPGESIEGAFTLRTLRPAYDTSAFRAPGQYLLRFIFGPKACFASPDGRFCLQRPEHQPQVASNAVVLNVLSTASAGER